MTSKKAFAFAPFGPWPKGMMNLARDTEVPRDALRDALNVDVQLDGTVVTRSSWVNLLEASNCHSLYYHRPTDRAYGVIDGDVSELTETGFTSLTPVTRRLSWTDLNGAPIFATRSEVNIIENGFVRRFDDGSALDEQDVDDVLVPMPGGQWIEHWNGRLVVARGTSLLFSEPLRQGAHNPMTGYAVLGARIEWLAPLESGIFVGLPDRVLWFQGRTPSEAQLRVVAGESAPGMAVVVPSDLLGISESGEVAVFFTRSGFAVGYPDGTVAYPQSGLVGDLPLQRGKIVVLGSRLYAVQEN